MGSGDRAINEKSGRALALPRLLTFESVWLYKEEARRCGKFRTQCLRGTLPNLGDPLFGATIFPVAFVVWVRDSGGV